MTPVNSRDLPKDVRDRIDAVPPERKKPHRQVNEPGLPLTCHSCGVVLHPATLGALRRHQDATTHGRFEWRATDGDAP